MGKMRGWEVLYLTGEELSINAINLPNKRNFLAIISIKIQPTYCHCLSAQHTRPRRVQASYQVWAYISPHHIRPLPLRCRRPLTPEKQTHKPAYLQQNQEQKSIAQPNKHASKTASGNRVHVIGRSNCRHCLIFHVSQSVRAVAFSQSKTVVN